MSETTILVHLEGGIIQDILGIPEGVKVIVRDYDTDELCADDIENLTTTNNEDEPVTRFSDCCFEEEWPGGRNSDYLPSRPLTETEQASLMDCY